MSIAAQLAAQPVATEPKYKASTEFDGITGFIQTAPVENPPTDYDELLKFFGYDPEQVEIFGDPQTRRWQTYDERWLSYFKFTIRKRSGRTTGDALIKLIENHKPHTPVQGGPAFFNMQASDTQLGKSDNGGTDGIITRYLDSLERARCEYLDLRKRQRIGGVHLMFPGDCIEGNQSQSGRNMWRTDLTLTEQIAVFERLLYATIDAFVDDTDELLLDVVNGNHDEAQRFQTTRPGDGWATHAANSVAKGLERNTSAYGHVQVRVPDPEQGYMTVPAGDTIFTIAHGHQWRRGKAMDWWADQSFHGQNPGGAHLLVHGHYHTFELETTKSRTRIQSSTLDGGSNYYRERTGAESRQGALVYVTQAGLPSDISLV
ncbi:hypothetical protein [Rhodococcoides fascians]|uniref:hypothetical protein n=1 Tax=Rhodococcoides fascians TaxID=1828 RepID=UPI00055B8409|nr:hypothetical protein [Rhodococcus fascians]